MLNERALEKARKALDEEALDKHMGIVYKIVKRYGNNDNREDLIQEGCKGLLYAKEHIKYGVYGVYATVCVRRFILDYLYRDRTIRSKDRKTDVKIIKINKDISCVDDQFKYIDLFDMLDCIIETQMDKIVVTRRIEGYNDREIAKELGCSISKVTRSRNVLEARYDSLKDEKSGKNLDV